MGSNKFLKVENYTNKKDYLKKRVRVYMRACAYVYAVYVRLLVSVRQKRYNL